MPSQCRIVSALKFISYKRTTWICISSAFPLLKQTKTGFETGKDWFFWLVIFVYVERIVKIAAKMAKIRTAKFSATRYASASNTLIDKRCCSCSTNVEQCNVKDVFGLYSVQQVSALWTKRKLQHLSVICCHMASCIWPAAGPPRGRHSRVFSVELCRTGLHILTLFKIKIVDFATLFK